MQKKFASQIDEFLDVIYHQANDIEHLKNELDDLRIKIEKQNSDMIAQQSLHEEQQKQLQSQLDQAKQDYFALINSSSWHVTKPIRQVKIFISFLKHASRVAIEKPSIIIQWFKKYLFGISTEQKTKSQTEIDSSLTNKDSDKEIPNESLSVNLDNYQNWFHHYYHLTDTIKDNINQDISKWNKTPVISIIIPVYNTNKAHLIAAIESVKSQLYRNWQLCIVDDASTQAHIKPLLEQYQNEDERIVVTFRKDNGHISEASNSAIKTAVGDYIGFLDHDDLLIEDALYWVAKTINEHPNCRFIYSDEDRLDEQGQLNHPYFKPNWNPELFHSHNYLTHFAVYHKSVIDKVGGFRSDYDGAQDYDLALRVIDQIEPNDIQHIARILYHWRMIPQSTASGLDAKPYAFDAGLKALDDYLERNNIKAKAANAPNASGNYRIKYDLPNEPPFISLIIPTYNQYRILRQGIDSILSKTDYPNYEIIIVDNNSDDPITLTYLSRIEERENITVLRYPHEFNFSAINNFAVKHVASDFIGFLNNDLEVISSDWLSEMISHALQPGVGAVGAKLLYPNETLQHAGILLGIAGSAGHAHKGFHKDAPGHANRALLIQNYSGVTAACMILKKKIFEELGGFDEEKLKVAFNDVDLNCKITNAGYRIVWTPYAQLYHHESISRGYEDTPEKRQRMLNEVEVIRSRWEELLENDPNYNPNLSLKSEDFALAHPPRIDNINHLTE